MDWSADTDHRWRAWRTRDEGPRVVPSATTFVEVPALSHVKESPGYRLRRTVTKWSSESGFGSGHHWRAGRRESDRSQRSAGLRCLVGLLLTMLLLLLLLLWSSKRDDSHSTPLSAFTPEKRRWWTPRGPHVPPKSSAPPRPVSTRNTSERGADPNAVTLIFSLTATPMSLEEGLQLLLRHQAALCSPVPASYAQRAESAKGNQESSAGTSSSPTFRSTTRVKGTAEPYSLPVHVVLVSPTVLREETASRGYELLREGYFTTRIALHRHSVQIPLEELPDDEDDDDDDDEDDDDDDDDDMLLAASPPPNQKRNPPGPGRNGESGKTARLWASGAEAPSSGRLKEILSGSGSAPSPATPKRDAEAPLPPSVVLEWHWREIVPSARHHCGSGAANHSPCATEPLHSTGGGWPLQAHRSVAALNTEDELAASHLHNALRQGECDGSKNETPSLSSLSQVEERQLWMQYLMEWRTQHCAAEERFNASSERASAATSVPSYYQCYQRVLTVVSPSARYIGQSSSARRRRQRSPFRQAIQSEEERLELLTQGLVERGEVGLEHLIEAALKTSGGQRGEWLMTLSSSVMPSAAPFTVMPPPAHNAAAAATKRSHNTSQTFDRPDAALNSLDHRYRPSGFMTALLEAATEVPADDRPSSGPPPPSQVEGDPSSLLVPRPESPLLQIAGVQCTLVRPRTFPTKKQRATSLAESSNPPVSTPPRRNDRERRPCVTDLQDAANALPSALYFTELPSAVECEDGELPSWMNRPRSENSTTSASSTMRYYHHLVPTPALLRRYVVLDHGAMVGFSSEGNVLLPFLHRRLAGHSAADQRSLWPEMIDAVSAHCGLWRRSAIEASGCPFPCEGPVGLSGEAAEMQREAEDFDEVMPSARLPFMEDDDDSEDDEDDDEDDNDDDVAEATDETSSLRRSSAARARAFDAEPSDIHSPFSSSSVTKTNDVGFDHLPTRMPVAAVQRLSEHFVHRAADNVGWRISFAIHMNSGYSRSFGHHQHFDHPLIPSTDFVVYRFRASRAIGIWVTTPEDEKHERLQQKSLPGGTREGRPAAFRAPVPLDDPPKPVYALTDSYGKSLLPLLNRLVLRRVGVSWRERWRVRDLEELGIATSSLQRPTEAYNAERQKSTARAPHEPPSAHGTPLGETETGRHEDGALASTSGTKRSLPPSRRQLHPTRYARAPYQEPPTWNSSATYLLPPSLALRAVPLLTYHADYVGDCTGLGRESTGYIAALQERFAVYMADQTRGACSRQGNAAGEVSYWKVVRPFFFGIALQSLPLPSSTSEVPGGILDIDFWRAALERHPVAFFLHMRASGFPGVSHEIYRAQFGPNSEEDPRMWEPTATEKTTRRVQRYRAKQRSMGRLGYTVGRALSEFSNVSPDWQKGLTGETIGHVDENGKVLGTEHRQVVDEFWVTADFFGHIYRRHGVPPEKIRWMPVSVDTFTYDPTAGVAPGPTSLYWEDESTYFQSLAEGKGSTTTTSRPSADATPTSVDAPLQQEDDSHAAVFDNKPMMSPAERRQRFIFLSTFKWEDRKGWNTLLEAYFCAFSPAMRRQTAPPSTSHATHFTPKEGHHNAGAGVPKQGEWESPNHKPLTTLIIKTSFEEPYAKGVKMGNFLQFLDQWLVQHSTLSLYVSSVLDNDFPHIIVTNKKLSDEALVQMYASADAFVMPTRGEGWGLPLAEAMSMGLPVIAPYYSGVEGFLTHDNAFLIPLEGLDEVPRAAMYGFYPGTKWSVPSAKATSLLLQYVYEHPAHAQVVGRRARAMMREFFSEEEVADRMDAAIVEGLLRQRSAIREKGL